jgi:hypothetical protein
VIVHNQDCMQLHLDRFPWPVLFPEPTSGEASVMCSSTGSKVQVVVTSTIVNQVWESLPHLTCCVLHREILLSAKTSRTQ